MDVSVVVTTYNHRSYIEQAIQSALMQEGSLDYEIIIIDDCSTDGTREIVQDLHRRHPERIRLILSPTNKNDSRNFARAIETATSRYIAFLEGDDYWTSPHKLQKQVDFLDRHVECATCFHNVLELWDDGRVVPHNGADHKVISGMEDLLAGNFMATVSVMFRRGLFGAFPEWFFHMPIGDWPLHILNTQHGQIGYIPEIMASYRIHANGLWSKRSRRQKLETVLAFYREMNAHLAFAYDAEIRRHMAQTWFDLAIEIEERDGDPGYARRCVAQSLRARPFSGPVPTLGRAKRWVRLAGESLLSRRSQ
jgi:glycosyltransferase involved in cell wall biosynthesis